MKRVSTTIAGALAALLITAAGPAFAQAGALAAVGSMGYELIDLDQADGVTPWLAFDDPWSWTYAAVFPGTSTDATPLALQSVFAPGDTDIEKDGAHAHAGAWAASVNSFAVTDGRMAVSTALAHRDFLLSPNTEVRFFAYAALQTDAEASFSTLAGSALVASVGGSLASRDEIDVRNGENYSGWTNTSAASYGTAAVRGWVAMGTYTESYAAAPVPEPAMPAMLLGGLGVLAAIARRRVSAPPPN
jgi:hypothetical protein